ncbi:MAG: hypothetical protein U5R31_04005 [Acidimicrobiia bacterium]|nr:hypothetical protein [Acidimicrobiia bacterium]
MPIGPRFHRHPPQRALLHRQRRPLTHVTRDRLTDPRLTERLQQIEERPRRIHRPHPTALVHPPALTIGDRIPLPRCERRVPRQGLVTLGACLPSLERFERALDVLDELLTASAGEREPRTSRHPWFTNPPPRVSADSSVGDTSGGRPATSGNGSSNAGGHEAGPDGCSTWWNSAMAQSDQDMT